MLNLSNFGIDGLLPKNMSFSQNGWMNSPAIFNGTSKMWSVKLSANNQSWNFSLELEIIQDTDHDKIANNLDSDDDNDNFTDSLDSCPLNLAILQ